MDLPVIPWRDLTSPLNGDPLTARQCPVQSQAVVSLVGGQCGSEGGDRQPELEAWSIRVRVARATIGRVSSARWSRAQAQRGTGGRTGRRVNVGGIGAA